jgi:hypothetical protein
MLLMIVLLMIISYTSLILPWIYIFYCFCRIFSQSLYSPIFCLFSLRLYRHFLFRSSLLNRGGVGMQPLGRGLSASNASLIM